MDIAIVVLFLAVSYAAWSWLGELADREELERQRMRRRCCLQDRYWRE